MTDENYKFEVGKEYKMRGGLVATILDVNYKGGGGYKIAGKINKDGCEQVMVWRSDGAVFPSKNSHPYDLMPPVETKELWVNVFTSHVVWWGAKDDAMRYMLNDDRIGTIHIVIEGGDFTIEKVAK